MFGNKFFQKTIKNKQINMYEIFIKLCTTFYFFCVSSTNLLLLNIISVWYNIFWFFNIRNFLIYFTEGFTLSSLVFIDPLWNAYIIFLNKTYFVSLSLEFGIYVTQHFEECNYLVIIYSFSLKYWKHVQSYCIQNIDRGY